MFTNNDENALESSDCIAPALISSSNGQGNNANNGVGNIIVEGYNNRNASSRTSAYLDGLEVVDEDQDEIRRFSDLSSIDLGASGGDKAKDDAKDDAKADAKVAAKSAGISKIWSPSSTRLEAVPCDVVPTRRDAECELDQLLNHQPSMSAMREKLNIQRSSIKSSASSRGTNLTIEGLENLPDNQGPIPAQEPERIEIGAVFPKVASSEPTASSAASIASDPLETHASFPESELPVTQRNSVPSGDVDHSRDLNQWADYIVPDSALVRNEDHDITPGIIQAQTTVAVANQPENDPEQQLNFIPTAITMSKHENSKLKRKQMIFSCSLLIVVAIAIGSVAGIFLPRGSDDSDLKEKPVDVDQGPVASTPTDVISIPSPTSSPSIETLEPTLAPTAFYTCGYRKDRKVDICLSSECKDAGCECQLATKVNGEKKNMCDKCIMCGPDDNLMFEYDCERYGRGKGSCDVETGNIMQNFVPPKGKPDTVSPSAMPSQQLSFGPTIARSCIDIQPGVELCFSALCFEAGCDCQVTVQVNGEILFKCNECVMCHPDDDLLFDYSCENIGISGSCTLDS